MPDMEVMAQEGNARGVSPVWDNGRGRLLWADAENKQVLQLMPTTRARAVISRGLSVSSIVLHKSRAIVFAGESGLQLWDAQGSYRTLVNEDREGKLPFRVAVADPRGRIYAATSYWGEASSNGGPRSGKLYLLEGRTLRVVDEPLRMANALAWSPDDRTLYLAEGVTRRILAYDVEKTGDLKNKRTFVQVPREEGVPMALAVDADGGVWCAHWYTGEVVRYTMDGRADKRLSVPAKQVSGLAFGGDTLKDLYITTASTPLPAAELAPPGCTGHNGELGGAMYRQKITFTQGRPINLTGVM
jgi:sugar lactone lactonase YvrE